MRNATQSIVLGSIGICFLEAILSAPAWGQNPDMQNQNPQNQNAHTARPGAINYVEGDAAIDGQPLNPDAVGSVELQKGQILTTQAGKVEILLTPGVFLRVADNSAVKMVSPDLANTEVELEKGRAMVEVTDISKNNNIRVDQNGASTQLLKRGLYDFDAEHNQVRVFKGKADVFVNNQKIGVGDNREVTLTAGGKRKASMSGNIPTTSIAGRACVPDISLRPTRIPRGCTSMAALVGTAPVGIGIRGSAPTRLSQGMGFSIAHSAGASTRPSLFMVRHFFMADTTVMATLIASVNSTNRMDMASSHAEDFTAPLVSLAAVASTVVVEDSRVAEAAGTS
jgi:FecR-like protein